MIEKTLTTKQKETIVNLFVNLLRNGNKFVVESENRFLLKLNDKKYSIHTSKFGDGRKIIMLSVSSDIRKSISLSLGDVKYMTKEILILQKYINDVIDNTTFTNDYSEEEFNNIVGFDDLIEQRSKKLGNIVTRIKDNQ